MSSTLMAHADDDQAKDTRPAERVQLPLPTFGQAGLRGEVDLDDSNALLDLMETTDELADERNDSDDEDHRAP